MSQDLAESKSDILKAIQGGKNPYVIIIKLSRLISVLTNDKGFSAQIENDLAVLYGEVLQEQKEVELLRFQAEQRLAKLKAMAKCEIPIYEREIINRAIREHKKELESYKAKEKGEK